MESANLMLIPKQLRVCQECLQYLSVGPVKIRPNGEVICGRCVKKFENDEVLVKSLFNIVVQKMLFPCVNHFDGCDSLISFNDAPKHESEHPKVESNNCKYCSFNGTFCQLFNHIKFCHSEKIIQNGTFEIKLELNFESALILCENSNILFLTMWVDDGLINIFPSIVNNLLENEDVALKFFRDNVYLEYNLKIGKAFNVELKTLYSHFGDIDSITTVIIVEEVEKKRCQEMKINLQKQYFTLQKKLCDLTQNENYIKEETQNLQQEKENFAEAVKKTETSLKKQKEDMEAASYAVEMDNIFLKEIYKKLSISLFTCVFCNCTITGKTIYFCPKNHAACDNCVTSKCKICNVICQWSEFKELGNIKVICDWANCPQLVPILEYLPHKQCCQFRRYKCPLRNCSFVGPSADFINHWHCKIPQLVVDSDTLEIDAKDVDDFEAYWIYKSEFYHILFKSRTVQINCTDVLLPNNFQMALKYWNSNMWNAEITIILIKENENKANLSVASGYKRKLRILDKNTS